MTKYRNLGRSTIFSRFTLPTGVGGGGERLAVHLVVTCCTRGWSFQAMYSPRSAVIFIPKYLISSTHLSCVWELGLVVEGWSENSSDLSQLIHIPENSLKRLNRTSTLRREVDESAKYSRASSAYREIFSWIVPT